MAEYSPITHKMYCFVCGAFGHRVHVLLVGWTRHLQQLVLKAKGGRKLPPFY